MTDHEEPLHQRLVRLRKAKGLSAKSMAKLIDVAETTYREWEYGRGHKPPPWQKISQVLAISVSELVTGQKPDYQSLLDGLALIESNVRELRIKLGTRI